ncbi:MAG: hypothetical protein GEV03_13900 [Streptosporangiales bacterium]|nr:hypothetical protein [Streptosporangiales bacterium]
MNPCRWCDGTGTWHPEKPHRSEAGEITWIQVAETCRMCVGIGEEQPRQETASSQPARSNAPPVPYRDALRAERERLTTRLQEIDAALSDL